MFSMGLIRRPKFWIKFFLVVFIIFAKFYYFSKNNPEKILKINTFDLSLFIEQSTISSIENLEIKSNTPNTVNLNVTTNIPPEISEKLENQNVIKVIILSVNPRSGSTYLSEILAAPPMTSMWQEPLRFLYEHPPKYTFLKKINNDSNISNTQRPILKDPRYRKQVPFKEKLKMIGDFMNCNFSHHLELLASQVRVCSVVKSNFSFYVKIVLNGKT